MIKILLLISFLCVSTIAFSQDLNKLLVGKVYRNVEEIPFFKEVKGHESVLLQDSQERLTDYALTHVKKMGISYVILVEFVGDKAKPDYKVLRVLKCGPLANHNRLILEQCSVGGKVRHGLIAIVVYEEGKERRRNIVSAWRVNTTKAEFIPVSPKGITCYNDDYGV